MSTELEKGLVKAGVVGAARHLFLCIGPDCCRTSEGELLWEYVKKRVREVGLQAMRTKAACLRVCTQGPWLVIYPDGVWYGTMTPARFERILQQHLLGGQTVEEWVVIRNSLSVVTQTPRGAVA